MYKVLYINSVCGFGSTGRIVADLTKTDDYESLVCFGRKKDFANVNSFQFANFFDNAFGAIRTILFDNNLNICTYATKRLIKKIREYDPDIIHLHNIHGYYVNVEMLLSFLKDCGKPVVWTLHDCWPCTGYCTHFEGIGCEKYKNRCFDCKMNFIYPFSIFKQNVERDFDKKIALIGSMDNLVFVTPSKWLKNIIGMSRLKNVKTIVINNGIELDSFRPTGDKNKDFTVLAVSSIWTKAKGTEDIEKMIPLLDEGIRVKVIGQGSTSIKGVEAMERTENKDELIRLYSESSVLINPTYQDNFPTVNIEALACGTPVITYRTGGSPEIIDGKTGIVVDKGNYQAMAEVINELYRNNYLKSEDCVKRSSNYSKKHMMKRYGELYESLLAE